MQQRSATTSPNRRTRAWAADAIGGGARVVRCERLHGGITSAVHGLVLEASDGARHALVLRQWTRVGLQAGARRVRHETQVLRALHTSPLAVPRLVAADPDGARTGGFASLLMTRLPGQMDLTPADPTDWLRQFSATLAAIHATSSLGGLPDCSESHAPRARSAGWSTHPRRWRRLYERVRAGPPELTAGLQHGDFQPFNMLWSGGQVAGIVDWVSAGIGPIDYDVGHAELNLAVLFGPDWAQRFRVMYEAEAGRKVDPVWEARGVLEYGPDWPAFIPIQVGSRGAVDVPGMHARVDALAAEVLERLE